MGYQLTQAVLDGLFGRELTVESIDTKSGAKKVKRLSAQHMALLLTVAARQYDPNVFPNDSNPIWYANAEKICKFVHFEKSALYDSRNFLVKLGVLRYAKSMRHMDYKHPSSIRTYDNVYQIDLKKLKSLAADLGIRDTESPLREADSKVRNTETHTDLRDTPQQTNRQGLSDVDRIFVERVMNEIAASLGISTASINRNTVAAAIRGKFPDTVFDAIRDPNGWFRTARSPISAIVTVLRQLPLQANDPNYRRQKQPTVGELLANVSSTAQYLIKEAIRNTGCSAAAFVQRLIPLLSRLLATPQGHEFAVETIDQHKKKGSDVPLDVAKQLLRALTQGI